MEGRNITLVTPWRAWNILFLYTYAITWATVINSCMDVLVDTDHVMEQLAQCGKLLCTNSPIGY